MLMSKPYTYYYNAQIKRYIAQFMRIFSGIQVQYNVDRNKDGQLDRKSVPVYYGGMDRMEAEYIRDRNHNTAPSLPLITGLMTAVRMNPEKKKSPMHRETITRTRNGLKGATERLMPVPYKLDMELSILASNTDQLLQILEQILILFNPRLTIQKSDSIHDWTSIVEVELTDIGNETNYPLGTNVRVVSNTLRFSFDVWLNFPLKEHDGVIERIITNINDETIEIEGLENLGEE